MVMFKSKSDTTATATATTTTPSVAPPPPQQQQQQQQHFDTTPIWESASQSYDKDIGWDERVMGIGLLRRWLIGHAKGRVLEVSTGTGRNLDYYPSTTITSMTFTDRHTSMLKEAEQKYNKSSQSSPRSHAVTFAVSDISQPTTPSHSYDTIVDTFGLCSCTDPVEALISLVDACADTESRILLLEHGRSHYDWLNTLLDTNADKHVARWGCWWNRDLMALLQNDRIQQRMEIVSLSRWHFGTTYCIVAKPKSSSPPLTS
ncbi:hypothetical protein BDF14DRAFT_1724803 [Spinellus fusiger]|nr:hypothetical protein BDF14DRAFT_1724803 [Spinellus fusiger]